MTNRTGATGYGSTIGFFFVKGKSEKRRLQVMGRGLTLLVATALVEHRPYRSCFVIVCLMATLLVHRRSLRRIPLGRGWRRSHGNKPLSYGLSLRIGA